MKIGDIIEEQKVELKGLITKCEKSKTAKDTPYLSLILEDDTGVLDAKFWNLTLDQVNQYQVGMVVEASGDIIMHRNAIQLRVRKMVELENENINDYVPKAPMSRLEMENAVDELLSMMDNEILFNLTTSIIDNMKEAYFTYPAATRNHHNFVGGLAYHSITMTRIALDMCKYYPWLDKSLLIAGTLMHDIGKINELSAPILPEYTNEGNLLGHISIMNTWIDREACKLNYQDEECVLLLKHMILSHHGKLEFGSPVLPMIPEAEILNLVDNLDARMYMMKKSIDVTQPGHFGPRIFALENRMVYRKNEDDE